MSPHFDHDEVTIEPIPGLPHALPSGERILWQGRPQWRGLLRHTFHVRWLLAYFALIVVACGGGALLNGHSIGDAILASAQVIPLAAVCIGILALLAWLNARATVYTLTSRRIVMRIGVALPMTFNLPFARLAAANLVTRKGGEGDIALELLGPDRLAWLHLWPHARPFRFARAQPMMRSIPEAAAVADRLAAAVQGWSAATDKPILIAAAPAPVADAAACVPVVISEAARVPRLMVQHEAGRQP